VTFLLITLPLSTVVHSAGAKSGVYGVQKRLGRPQQSARV
jgi:hypothetical protein